MMFLHFFPLSFCMMLDLVNEISLDRIQFFYVCTEKNYMHVCG